MTLYDVVLLVLWAVFIAVWLFGALTSKRTVRRNWFGEIWWRVGIIATVIVLVQFLWGSPYITGVVSVPLLNLAGVICAAGGVGFSVWARMHLGSNWGMPMTEKEKPELVTSGPYAYIRNPIYTGILLVLFGSALVDWWWAVVLMWSGAYYVYASRKEEQLMFKRFPNVYPAYHAHTWRLIPWVW